MNGSTYLRIPIEFTQDQKDDLDGLRLNVKYDDAFVAYLWFNGLKNARTAVGYRNYESLSGFALFNDQNADQQIVCRRNTWTKGNSAWTYGDATGNTGTVRTDKTMIAMSV